MLHQVIEEFFWVGNTFLFHMHTVSLVKLSLTHMTSTGYGFALEEGDHEDVGAPASLWTYRSWTDGGRALTLFYMRKTFHTV